MFPYWVKVLKLFKREHFLQFCAGLGKQSESIKAIYIYTSECSLYTLSENDMVYRDLSLCSWNIIDQNIKKDADSAEI